MTTPDRYPIYVKFTIIVVGLYFFLEMLDFASEIILQLVYAALIALLLNPFVTWLENRSIPKILAIGIAVSLTVALVLIVSYFLFTQFSKFSDAWPQLKAKGFELYQNTLAWLNNNYGISTQTQTKWVNDYLKSMNGNGSMVVSALSALTGMAVVLMLLPVYVSLMLYYRNLFLDFIRQVFANENHGKVIEIMTETKSVLQNYMKGLLIEAVIVAAMNVTGLLILDIKYAFLLGVVGALLNLIPYIGGIVAVALPVAIALITKGNISYPLGIIGIYMFIQFIDNNFIVPKIVASRVQINALVSIVAVLIGGAMEGVPGMFLSLPIVAIIKIIFDRVEHLKPWGRLLGDEVPTRIRFGFARHLVKPEPTKD